MAKQEIEMHGLEDQVDEMDFGSIGKTLSKYGKGVPDAAPKAVKRSSVHTDYTMTGHKEKKSGTGRVYTKVLADYDDDAGKAAKATQAPDQVEAPKRGRGRPAGAVNKNGSGITGKGWSAEAKASMKAKLAANKAAKLAAAKNESEDLDEATIATQWKQRVKAAHGKDVTFEKTRDGTYAKSAGKTVGHMDHSTGRTSVYEKLPVKNESEEIDEAADAKQLQADYDGYMKAHARTGDVKYKHAANQVKSKMDNLGLHGALKTAKATPSKRFESVEITEKDWADITEGQSLDAIVEFMMEEEYQSLDELSKKTLGSYIKKANTDVARKYNHINDLDSEGSDYEDAKDSKAAAKKYKEADTLQKQQQQRINNVGKAEIKLRNESAEDLNIQRYAALIGKNLIKE